MESKDVLELFRLNATPLLPTIRRWWPRERVPAEGDKGVTGSSEVTLVISL